jgi:ADP-heptose:LPS heptosyltransferase
VRPSRPNRRYQAALFIDRRLGPVLCALLLVAKRLARRRAPELDPAEVRSVLVVKLWGMGSIVLASPVLRELRVRYPGARIDFLTLRENAQVLGFYPDVDRVHGLDLSRGIARFLLDTVTLLGRLRRERYDLLLDLEFFTRFSAIASFVVRARRSHGFSAKGSWRGRLHDVEAPFNAYHHVALNFLSLLRAHPVEPLPVSDEAFRGGESLPPLRAPESAWASCTATLRADPAWREGAPIVVVNANAGDMALERRWPAERVAELLRGLVAGEGPNVVLIGAAAERDYVRQVASAPDLAQRVTSLAGRTTLPELVALLEHADLVVTNDSGPLHLACAAGASTVALFGPETPSLYGPLRSRPGQDHAVHYRGLACSPCMFVHDNKVLSCWFAQARCMTDIRAEDVLASARALLARRTSGSVRPARPIHAVGPRRIFEP